MLDYDPALCLQNLQSKGLSPACQALITPFHCDDVTSLDPTYHAMCSSTGQLYFPIICIVCRNSATNVYRYFSSDTVIEECQKLQSADRNWKVAKCYCCCSCLANDTLIAVPSGQVPIVTIQMNDEVLAGSTTTPGGTSIAWSPLKVRFSMGSGSGGHQPMMVYIVYGEGNGTEIICNVDQPFLLSDGKLTTGGRLRPGQQLVDRDGKPVSIQMVSVGEYHGGVHHIATDAPWTGSVDGHLLLAAGVVAGDFTLQSRFAGVPAKDKEDGYDELPLLGTAEYDAAHNGTLRRADAIFEFVSAEAQPSGTQTRPMSMGIFHTYRTAGPSIPDGASMFLRPEQAADIMTNGSQAPLSNTIPEALFNSIRQQMKGFFPDVTFYYDALEVTPNLYAFEAYGQKIVQVNGGLARMKGFNYEGLFTAMAHGISCFYGGEPKNAAGYSAVGQADLWAFGVVSRLLWISDPMLDYVLEAITQWQDLFALVAPDHAGGNPLDPLNDPSLECRIKTIKAGTGGGALPECAGGIPLRKISLVKAEATSFTEITVNFNLAINNETGNVAANYTLDPAAPISEAKLDDSTGFIAHLTATLAPDTDYVLTVGNLVSILNTGLDPAHVTAGFKSPAA